MSKQVIISMEDFKRIESVYKELDRALYLFECAYECIDDEEAIKKMDKAFEKMNICREGLGSAIK